jgi:hypothetical protein
MNLSVQRRAKYKENPYYFQINIFTDSPREGLFTKDILEQQFSADKNFYLLFVYFDRVKQKVDNYVWLIPSLYFEDIAQLANDNNGEKVLRFLASLSVKNKDKYSKFLVDTKDLGKMIFDAFENKGKIDFEETIFQEKESVNEDRLFEFIAEARRNTFAVDATVTSNPRLLGSTQFDFQKGDFSYRDVYFAGNKKFIGMEMVYQSSKLVWGMNYIGNQVGKLEESFLRESLYRLVEKCRFGKICDYEKREFRYQDSGQGNLESFFGEEQIFTEGKSIYKMDYRGGLISDKL